MTAGRQRGNYLAEWYGFRVWPTVDASDLARRFQVGEDCPFITAATGQRTACVKQARTGVCTVSSPSNGIRQDWPACPFRILDARFTLLDAAVRRLFGIAEGEPILLRPVSALENEVVYREVSSTLQAGSGRVFVFSQIGLGGEVKIPATPGSPQIEVDSSVVELIPGAAGGFQLGRSLFFELQTMDFHGSPLHAAGNLKRARDLDPEDYHQAVRAHPEWAGDRVEGPNKAHVFKRTIYQTVLEIQLSRVEECAGFVIALPEPVWDSWRAHLGMPDLDQEGDLWRLRAPQAERSDAIEADRAWILVFDIDRDSRESPQPLKIVRPIVTTSAALIHYMFEAAPEYAIRGGALVRYRTALSERIRQAMVRP